MGTVGEMATVLTTHEQLEWLCSAERCMNCNRVSFFGTAYSNLVNRMAGTYEQTSTTNRSKFQDFQRNLFIETVGKKRPGRAK
jgi:hypothetical protein